MQQANNESCKRILVHFDTKVEALFCSRVTEADVTTVGCCNCCFCKRAASFSCGGHPCMGSSFVFGREVVFVLLLAVVEGAVVVVVVAVDAADAF